MRRLLRLEECPQKQDTYLLLTDEQKIRLYWEHIVSFIGFVVLLIVCFCAGLVGYIQFTKQTIIFKDTSAPQVYFLPPVNLKEIEMEGLMLDKGMMCEL